MKKSYGDIKETIIAIIITIIAAPLHELGHWFGYRVDDIPAVIGFNYTEPLGDAISIYGLLGGPVMSLTLALAGVVALYITEKNKDVWAYITIIMCLTRLDTYLFSILGGVNTFYINDEGLIAKAMNLPVWMTYGIFLAAFLMIILAVVYKLRGRIREHIKKFKLAYILHFFVTIIFVIRII
ncbi:hypothetical protein [uncultured Clostridium sp.]|uniref:hypothetical protein n=1 Tax=uncultured Clostridium sp. TaxID=59620 RepID=UPI0028EA71EA|nr:hypothetical protein [uncultured Clostridium sp.]